MLRTQLLDIEKYVGTPIEFLMEVLKEAAEVDPKSYGMVMNTFYELESDYVNHLREVMRRKSWHVGPVSFYNKTIKEKSVRSGEQPLAYAATECLKWLDGKPPGSVMYTCFGSLGFFTVMQLREMAVAFEEAGHPFIWVVQNEGDAWMPEGYEERIKGRGMVIRGWAPQLLILNHTAVGGFMTHCGWNSSLEAICAGLPMVTWPLHSDQFNNEKLLVEVLKIAVAVGSKVYCYKGEGRPLVYCS
nr:putative glycosyltransferase [Anoectochilus roxburghii]